MSDLTATNCGCNNSCANANNNGFGSCMWIILLLLFCGGNGNDCGCGNGNSILSGNNNSCCEWLIWILLLSSFCGNGNGFGNNCGCGC